MHTAQSCSLPKTKKEDCDEGDLALHYFVKLQH